MDFLLPIGATVIFFIHCASSQVSKKNLTENDTTSIYTTENTEIYNNSTTETTDSVFMKKKGIAWRTLIVCICLTLFVLIYFGVRAIRYLFHSKN